MSDIEDKLFKIQQNSWRKYYETIIVEKDEDGLYELIKRVENLETAVAQICKGHIRCYRQISENPRKHPLSCTHLNLPREEWCTYCIARDALDHNEIVAYG